MQHHCDSCGNNEGIYHVTVTVDLYGGTSVRPSRRKVSQFWLCEVCELRNRDILQRDGMQRGRVAKLMTQELNDSEYQGWRYGNIYAK